MKNKILRLVLLLVLVPANGLYSAKKSPTSTKFGWLQRLRTRALNMLPTALYSAPAPAPLAPQTAPQPSTTAINPSSDASATPMPVRRQAARPAKCTERKEPQEEVVVAAPARAAGSEVIDLLSSDDEETAGAARAITAPGKSIITLPCLQQPAGTNCCAFYATFFAWTIADHLQQQERHEKCLDLDSLIPALNNKDLLEGFIDSLADVPSSSEKTLGEKYADNDMLSDTDIPLIIKQIGYCAKKETDCININATDIMCLSPSTSSSMSFSERIATLSSSIRTLPFNAPASKKRPRSPSYEHKIDVSNYRIMVLVNRLHFTCLLIDRRTRKLYLIDSIDGYSTSKSDFVPGLEYLLELVVAA